MKNEYKYFPFKNYVMVFGDYGNHIGLEIKDKIKTVECA